MKSSGMPWPGDEGEQRWNQAWTAIKKVRLLCLVSYAKDQNLIGAQ